MLNFKPFLFSLGDSRLRQASSKLYFQLRSCFHTICWRIFLFQSDLLRLKTVVIIVFDQTTISVVKNTGRPFTIDEWWKSLAFCYLWDKQNSVKIWSFSCKNINARYIDLVVLHHKQCNLDLTDCQHENYSLWKGFYYVEYFTPLHGNYPNFSCLFILLVVSFSMQGFDISG